ncbi:DNA polymerase POL4 like protein [Zymoseptoria brevis]|uniref:DNA polymerase lambda n=1 Tax=Zymoseptoria brevis TaxID=1047168 RepID=A0A0F4GRZ2_9PEZI|nr:DNA polymerase POL4 like protein [Zymoseptoria brevis]
MASLKELRKKELYDGLDGISDNSDDEPDLGRLASEAAMRKAMPPAIPAATRSLPRSVSDNSHSLLNALQPPSSTNPDLPPLAPPPLLKVKAATLQKAKSDMTGLASIPKELAASSFKATGKRKRDAVKMVPEEQQVFKDLNFYFFPNTEANPARRMRITKARQFGATRIEEWDNDSVTHVIMDQAFTLEQFLKFLRIDKVPSNVILVNEDYPADCVAHLTLLDPTWPQFAVKGVEPAPAKQEVPAVVPQSQHKSPELKPPARASKRKSQATPYQREHIAGTTSPVTLPQVDAAEGPTVSKTTISSSEEFDKAIATAKALAHVSLDEEEDADSRRDSIDGTTSGDDHDEAEAEVPAEESSGLKLLNQRKTKYQRYQDKFQCMQKNTGEKKGSPNLATIEILEQMVKYYTDTRDEWRSRAYRQAISVLRKHPTKVMTKEEALKLPKVGERLAAKIEEIAVTNRLRRLDNALAEPSDAILQTFMGVYGAGRVVATKWVDQGYTTLDELSKNPDLTTNQRIGLEHYEDFQTRIPRAEVAQHGEMVLKALHKIDPTFEVIIGGSYRRGAKDSGDIDCIITRPNTDSTHLRAVVLEQLIPQLEATNFLVASLAATDKDDGSKWHGASCLPGATIWRRIDLLLVPSDELGAALIYFTGNDIFNRSMRLLASTKGMRLNQRGLYKDTMRGSKRVKITEGTLAEGKDEKRIFEVLGVPWRPPHHRIC